MKKELLLVAAIALSACSRNPDPEYSPDAEAAPTEVIPATGGVAPAPATAAASEAAAAPEVAAAPAVARLSEEEAYRLGREAAAMLFADDMTGLFERFDAGAKAQVQSAENFGAMVGQVFAQTGVEGTMVEETVDTNPGVPGLVVYRRRGTYLATGSNLDLFVALNADGSIAGINIQPVE